MRDRRNELARRLAGLAFLLGSAGASTAWAQPVEQSSHSIGVEIEGMLQVTSSSVLSEKAEYRQNDTRSTFGDLPYITYELDQIDSVSAKTATAEIVTAPFANTAKGIETLLTAIKSAYDDAPRGTVTFTPAADFGGDAADGTISKLGSAGAPQVNLTVSAAKLMADTDEAATAAWSILTEPKHVAKIIPLVRGARDIVSYLTADRRALATWSRQTYALRLWMFVWLAKVSFQIEDRIKKAVVGYHKDRHGLTLKMKLHPVASGLPADVATAWEDFNAVEGPARTEMVEMAKRAITSSLGAPEDKVRAAWRGAERLLAISDDTVGTERPLDVRIIGTDLAPIVEARRSNSTINSAFRTAVDNVVFKKKPIAGEAAAFFEVVRPLLTSTR